MKQIPGWLALIGAIGAIATSFPAGAQTPARQIPGPNALLEPDSRIPRTPMLSVKPKALPGWLAANQGVLILDLRTEEAFRRQHLPGAVNLPLNALPARYPELPLDRVFLLVDENGTDTLLAGSYLKRKGFRHPVRLFGGMEAWQSHQQQKRK